MTHLSVPAERKKALGIDDNMVRISIGVEDADDLLADFEQALKMVRSEEHTSELQSLMRISYAVFCLKKKKKSNTTHRSRQRLTNKKSRIVTREDNTDTT